MNAERCRRHQPAIEASRGDDAFAIKNVCDSTAARERLVDCRHARPLGACAFIARLCGDSVGVDWMNQSKICYGAIEIPNEIMRE
jgi:hypothetical protein